MTKTVRIGSGLGFYGDAWEPVHFVIYLQKDVDQGKFIVAAKGTCKRAALITYTKDGKLIHD